MLRPCACCVLGVCGAYICCAVCGEVCREDPRLNTELVGPPSMWEIHASTERASDGLALRLDKLNVAITTIGVMTTHLTTVSDDGPQPIMWSPPF